MGIVNNIREFLNSSNGNKSRNSFISSENYVEINPDKYKNIENGTQNRAGKTLIHVAEPATQQDLMDIKDLIYEGDIVIVDLFSWEKDNERITRQLTEITEDIDGDIAMKGEKELIVVPDKIKISREKVGN